MAKKMYHIRGALAQVSSQRTQYKPYGYELSFFGDAENPRIMVELDIPEDCVIEETKDTVTINLEGLNAILKVTADSVDKLNTEHMKKVKGD